MKPAIIFDIDGTLADLTHRLGYIQGAVKDWESFHSDCYKDAPILSTMRIYRLLRKEYSGHVFILCTGRPEAVRSKTMGWLNDNEIRFDHLMMRADRDRREDVVIKREMLDSMRKFFRPQLVFEDRSSVVKMWREEGLQCFQVAEGDF